MALRDALDQRKTATVAAEQAESVKSEKKRIREKMPDDVRDFCDSVRAVFPNARLVGLAFSDGETIGRVYGNDV